MAYYPRKYILFDGSYFHITWQCHNQDWLLRADFAKQLYYQLLKKYKDQYGVSIFSYCLMSNHIHLVGHCEKVKRLSALMRLINSRFARILNTRMKRKGQVIMDRFKSPLIYTNKDLLKVMRYVDLNPFRASMVKHPKNYRWSSYNYYAYGKEDELITPSPAYEELGLTIDERQKTYISMVDELIESDKGKEKQAYSTTYFIGEPAWVK
ncbi:MAG: transposase, partial [Oligoflexia bacterium]|nr:transposase [Oligoflexia bacterium]